MLIGTRRRPLTCVLRLSRTFDVPVILTSSRPEQSKLVTQRHLWFINQRGSVLINLVQKSNVQESAYSHHLHLSLELFAEDILESLTVLGKLPDALMQLLKCHLLGQQRPAEFRLVVDKGDLFDGCASGSYIT